MFLHGINLINEREAPPMRNRFYPQVEDKIYVKLPTVPNDTAARFRDNAGIYEVNKIKDLLGGLRLYSVKVEMELLELGGRVAAHGDDFPCMLPAGMYTDTVRVEGVIE